MNRDRNQSADQLASEALRQDKGTVVISDQDHKDLITINRLGITITRTSRTCSQSGGYHSIILRRRCQPRILQDEVVQQIRINRIKQAQDEENWISSLKIYLVGDVARFSVTEVKVCARIAPDYEVD